jgi:hypothetical protein
VPAAHAMPAHGPTPSGVPYGSGEVLHGPGRSGGGPGRMRRWATSGAGQIGIAALVAGVIGGLIGGGIVAAFTHDDHDGPRQVRIERAVPFGGNGPGMRQRYWGRPPGNGWIRPDRPGMPTTPPTPTPPG